MSAQVEKKQETATVTTKDKKTQQKLYSVVFIWIAFVLLYLAVSSGSDGMMWAGLLLTIAASGYLYARN